LVIPHPRIYNRKFAMVPMLEIAPDFVDPYFQTSLKQLLENCPDKADVRLTDIIL
jgi:2-amino-4-hydroxy-6-hydroxymethyldihydropteridine diphosphokinase